MNKLEYSEYASQIFAKIAGKEKDSFMKHSTDFFDIIGTSFAGHSHLARNQLDKLADKLDVKPF